MAESNRLTIGTVTTRVSELIVRVEKADNGQQTVCLFINPKDGRRSGEIILLTAAELAKLKQLVIDAEAEMVKVSGSESGSICPNCKVPYRTTPPPKTCPFCGYINR